MNAPLVSIIIPSYNAANWLGETLDSAFAQTWPNKEIILVDDGSTDDSLAIARGQEARGLVIVTQPNRGAAAARNTGLAAARGEFIQFLDSDDLLAPDKISRQLSTLTSGSLITAGPWGTFHGHPSAARFIPEPVWADHAPVDWLVSSWAGKGSFPPLVWLTPRALIDAAGPWNESLSLDDDGEYFGRVLLQASQVRFVPDARSFYRAHSGPRVSALRGRRAAASSFASIESKARHLFARENSPRTQHALACHWQRFAFEQIVDAPDLAHIALQRSRELSPGLTPPSGPRAYTFAARVLGWPNARRLQLRAKRLLGR